MANPTTLLLLACCLPLANGVWTVTGRCRVDPADAECISTPHYPYYYDSSDYCSFQLDGDEQRMLLVKSFSTEYGDDLLYVDEQHFSGSHPVGLDGMVVNRTTKMWWKSDLYNNRAGWYICARAFHDPLGGPWHVSGSCTIDTNDPECVTSPNFPNNYNNNDNCEMRIFGQSRLLEMTEFHTEYRWDVLSTSGDVFGGYRTRSVSGSSAASWQGESFTERLLFNWTSDGAHTYGGWRMCGRLPPTTTTMTATTTTRTWTTTTRTTTLGIWNFVGDCQIDNSDNECLTSNNFPAHYGNNEICTMHLNFKRYIIVTDFETQQGHDNFTVFNFFSDGTDHVVDNYGPLKLHGLNIDVNMMMKWQTDRYNTRRGWRICARPYRNDETDGLRTRSWLMLGSCDLDQNDPDCMTSYKWPGNYRNYDWCDFRLLNESARLEVTSFDTGSLGDFMYINGKKYSMKSQDMYIDNKRYMGVSVARNLTSQHITNESWNWWRSNMVGTSKGWRLCARRIRNHDLHVGDSEYDGSSGGGALLGLIICVPAVCLLTGALCVWKGRTCWRWWIQPGSASGTSSSSSSTVRSTTVIVAADAPVPAPVPPTGQPIQCCACRHNFMLPDDSSDLRYTCPVCLAVNEFSITQEVAGTLPPEATLPDYWTSNRVTGLRDGLVQETPAIKKAMQILMDQTWKDTVTRDRPTGAQLSKFEVLMVHRNENASKWDRYVRTKNKIAGQCKGCRVQHVKTQTQVTDFPDTFNFLFRSKLDENCNEFYLFHGTNPAAARAICDNSFRMNMAGSHAGTLYGAGLYFAEASSKSDEYASEEAGGIFTGQFAMLVCRVVCGNMLYNDEEWPDTDELVEPIVRGRVKHSILGDRERCRGTYREFIVFDRDQVYPEYAIIYRRVPVTEEDTS